MSDDNVLNFPNLMPDAIDKQEWQSLQAEFYLDCYTAQHGKAAEDPEQLGNWLREAKIYADTENSFFRGWLMRRLAEA